MKKQIIINASKDRSRIAIVEDGELVELYVENPDNVRTIGNIYLGNVQKVLPTLRAGFVDIGEKQDAFLHFSDLTDNFPQLLAMSGNDVPGLDEPVLALAPQKRIADDELEPDVEDTLEIESGDDEPTRRRSTRSRRSRGRGGRGRSNRSEEEEEQEEAGEEKPRRGPLVLDLTTKPKTASKSASAPKRAPAAKKADPPAAETSDSASEEAPARPPRRAPRKKKTEATAAETATLAAEDATEAPAPKKRAPRKKKATEPATDVTTDATEAPAPKKRAPRKKKAAEPVAEALDIAEVNADAPATEAAPEAAPASRPRRAPRGRNKATGNTTADAPSASVPEESAPEKPAPKSRRSKTNDAPSTDEDASEDRPRSRRGRRTTTATDAAAPEKTPQADTAEETKDDRPRSRRKTRTDDSTSTEAPVKETPEATATPDAPKRSRGTMTIDLTSSAQKSARPAPRASVRAETPAEKTPDASKASDDSPSDDTPADDRPRSRRRTRGGDTEARTTPDAETAKDETPDERPRSRRGRRSREDETTDQKSDSSDDNDSGRGRSRRRGRSDDSSASDSDSKRASEKDESSTTRDDSRGRSDRSGSGSSRGRDSRGGDSRGGRSRSREAGERKGVIPSNEQLLKRGSSVIVKVTKEPISAKGSRVSTDISLAGRFLVLVPAADYVAVSKKIESARERKRLRTLAKNLKPDNCGVIVRTVAEGRDAKSLDMDLRLLIDKWRSIEAKLDGGKAKAPKLLYEDVNMVSSIVRDLFSEDFDRILVDDPKTFQNVQAYVRAVAPDMADKVELHRANTPVYRSVGIESQVEEAFSRRVNLKGGGYLFIETTEAMHVVDVNSGRAGRGKSQRENLIAVNVEAAHEVAKQLRLRDLGGIIVVDFIDLRSEGDRKKVTNALKEGFDKDRAVTKLLPMSDFGLVQITRQRLRPSITAQPEGDDGPMPTDPAERAARAGAGEIAPTGGRRGRQDETPSSRDLDGGPAAPEARTKSDDAPSRGRNDRSDGSRSRRRSRDERPRDESPREDATEAPRKEVDPMTTPEAVTARLRAWLDVYRKTVEDAYRDRPVVVRVHPLFLAHLQRGLVSTLTRWRIGIRSVPWRVEDDASMDPLSFDIVDEKSGRSLVKKYTL